MEEQKIDVTHFPDLACPKCQSKLLREAVIVKQIPKFIIGNADIGYAPAPVIVSPFKPFLQN